MDMSKTYRAAVDLCFPRARIVFDHFHVKKLVLDAMDRVRQEEQGKNYAKSRQAGKKLLMIPETRMTEQQKDRHAAICKAYPKTGRASRMVQLLDDFYHCCMREEAKQVLKKLTGWMMHSRLEPMKSAARNLRRNEEEILACFVKRGL